MRTNLVGLICGAVVLATAMAAQEQDRSTPQGAAPSAGAGQGTDGAPTDLPTLAAMVDRAHRPDGPIDPITAFAAKLSIEPLATTEEQAGQVDLDVSYMRFQGDPKRRARHFIRYGVKGTDQAIERGYDTYGYWQLEQGKAANITESDVEDRAAVKRDTMLARQLVRFLDPAAVLRSLGEPSPVRAGGFKIGRRANIPCYIVEGELPKFPLQRLAGAEQQVRLEVFVRRSDGRLLAVRARPVVAGQPIDGEAEMIRFDNYQLRAGLLVPKGLLVSFLEPGGAWRPQSRVSIPFLDLRPEFEIADFARPK